MAQVRKEDCACPRAKKATCRHKPWKVRYRGPGGRSGKQLEASFKTKELADAFAAKVEREKHLGTFVEPRKGEILFSKVWAKWLADGQRENSTLTAYDSIYRNHFESFFGSKPIGSITKEDISTWRGRQAKIAKPTTAHHRLVVLKTVFRYAQEEEMIGRNPALSARQRGRGTPITRAVKPTEIPSTGEVQALYEAMKSPLRATVWLQAGSGCRVGEALAVSQECLSSAGLLTLRQQLVTHNDKGKGRGVSFKNELKWSREGRDTPCSYTVQQAVERHVEEHGTWGERGWLFRSPKYTDQPISFAAYSDAWTAALEATGLKGSGYTPKSLRHYFASVCIAGGVPLYEVAQWMGHKSTRVTEQTYAHLLADANHRAMDAVEVAILEHARLVLRAGS